MLANTYSAQETRENLADILGMVYYSGEPVFVEKRGKPVAVLINPKDYELYLKEREQHFSVINSIQSKINKKSSSRKVEKEVNAIVHAVRIRKQRSKKNH